MAVINTNITALIGQQNLTRSQSALQTSMERLSSGLRINSAADDAAGQAIANRMSAQITGLSQAQRNANDGISVSQTAEGALNQINDNLQRIRQLTVQAQNGTNSASDLSSIQNEINQRLAEVNRVSTQTSFNGVKVLAKDQDLKIQVGANDGETITLNLKQIDASTLGLSDFHVNQGIDTTKVASSATTSVYVASSVAIKNSAHVAADVGTSGAGATGSFSAFYMTASGQYYGHYTGGTSTGGAAVSGYYALTVSSAGAVTVGASAAASAVSGLSAITNVQTSKTVAGLASGDSLRAYSGSNVGSYVIQNGSGSTATYYVANIDGSGNVTRGAQLSTDGDATANPLQKLDDALSQVDGLRSMLGASQNRFESAITNLGTTTTNLSAARSRIEDADYAVEVSNMTRAQILQQAGTAVLSQANQVPQSVLSLLR